MADYVKGTGADQLPQGGASAANAATPPPAPGPGAGGALSAGPVDIPVQYMQGPPLDVTARDLGSSENLQLLTDPAEPQWRPAPGSRGPDRLPASVVRNLPIMAVASKDPQAPRAIRALYRATVAQLELEQGTND